MIITIASFVLAEISTFATSIYLHRALAHRSLSLQPVTALLFSRGGLSWFGGLIGGIGTGLWMLRRRRVPIVRE